MARTIGKKTVYGGWVDAAGGYLAYATLLMAMGFSCYFTQGNSLAFPAFSTRIGGLPWKEATWILVGSIAALSNTLMRLFHQSFKNAELTAGIPFKQGAEKRFSEEIGVTGYLPLLYLVGYESGYLAFVLVAYTAVYTLGFAVSTLKELIKVAKSA